MVSPPGTEKPKVSNNALVGVFVVLALALAIWSASRAFSTKVNVIGTLDTGPGKNQTIKQPGAKASPEDFTSSGGKPGR